MPYVSVGIEETKKIIIILNLLEILNLLTIKSLYASLVTPHLEHHINLFLLSFYRQVSKTPKKLYTLFFCKLNCGIETPPNYTRRCLFDI